MTQQSEPLVIEVWRGPVPGAGQSSSAAAEDTWLPAPRPMPQTFSSAHWMYLPLSVSN